MMNFFDILFNQKFNGHKGSLIDQLFAAATKVYTTAKAAIVSFYTTRVAPLVALLAYIEPIQDLHGQSSPYPAGGGSNIWDEEWSAGRIGWAGTNAEDNNTIRSKNYIPVIAGNTYRVVTSNNLQIFYYDSGKQFVSYEPSSTGNLGAFIVPNGCAYIRFYAYGSNYGNVYKHDIAINYPSTVTTYSPYSNICPISGTTEVVVTRGGINQWDEEWEVGGIDDDTGLPLGENNRIRSKNFDACVPNTTYYTIDPTNDLNMRAFWYDADKNFISRTAWVGNNTITSPSNARYFKLKMAFAYGTTYKNDISINYPSADHDYHSYLTPLTITTSLGQTVYGGTVDVVSGKLTVDRGMTVLTSDLNYAFYTESGLNRITWADYQNIGKVGSNNFLSNIFKASASYTSMPAPWEVATSAATVARCFMGVPQTIASVDDWKAYITNNEVTMCYELATPTVIQLTPQEVTTLLGGNTVWVDTGDVSVTYTTKGR